VWIMIPFAKYRIFKETFNSNDPCISIMAFQFFLNILTSFLHTYSYLHDFLVAFIHIPWYERLCRERADRMLLFDLHPHDWEIIHSTLFQDFTISSVQIYNTVIKRINSVLVWPWPFCSLRLRMLLFALNTHDWRIIHYRS